MKSTWEILGIERTEDTREIKKAFLERSKAVHPEEEEEAFLELKNAYESALLEAKVMKSIREYRETHDDNLFESNSTSADSPKSTDEEKIKSQHLTKLIGSKRTLRDFTEFFANYSNIDKMILLNLDIELTQEDILSTISVYEDALSDMIVQDQITMIKTYFDTKFLNELILFLTNIDSLLQLATIEMDEDTLDIVKEQSKFLIESCDIIAYAISLLKNNDKLYLDSEEYSEVKFEQYFLFALEKFHKESDAIVKHKYKQMIILHELCRHNKKYKESTSKDKRLEMTKTYLTYRNNFFIIGENIDYDDKVRIENDIFHKYGGIDFLQREQEYYHYLESKETLDKLIFTPECYQLQKEVMRDYVLRKITDVSATMDEIELLIYQQWDRWSAYDHKVHDNNVAVFQKEYTHPLFYFVMHALVSSNFKNLKRKTDQELFNKIDKFVEKTRFSYMVFRRQKMLGVNKIGELIDITIGTLDIYQSARTAEIVSRFKVGNKEYQQLVAPLDTDRKRKDKFTIFKNEKKVALTSELYRNYRKFVPVNGLTISQKRRKKKPIREIVTIAVLVCILVVVKNNMSSFHHKESSTIVVKNVTIVDESKTKEDRKTRDINQEVMIKNLRIINEYLSATAEPFSLIDEDGLVSNKMSKDIIYVIEPDVIQMSRWDMPFMVNPADAKIKDAAKDAREKIIYDEGSKIIIYAIKSNEYSFINNGLSMELGLSEDVFEQFVKLPALERESVVEQFLDDYIEERKLIE